MTWDENSCCPRRSLRRATSRTFHSLFHTLAVRPRDTLFDTLAVMHELANPDRTGRSSISTRGLDSLAGGPRTPATALNTAPQMRVTESKHQQTGTKAASVASYLVWICP